MIDRYTSFIRVMKKLPNRESVEALIEVAIAELPPDQAQEFQQQAIRYMRTLPPQQTEE